MNARTRGEPLRERGMRSSHRPQQRCGRVREMRPSCRGATIDGSSRKVLQEASASSSCENRTGRICLVVTPPWRRLCIRTWSLRVVRHHFEAQSRLMPQGEERDKLAQTDGLIHYGRSEMCDYSLHNVASRAAKLGDKLVVTDFAQTITRGFAAIGEPDVAVCVLPGTELAFEAHVQYHHALSRSGMARVNHKVARFRQLNLENPHVHHDALEFPGGEIAMVTHLVVGQNAIVLQLPARPLKDPETRTEKPAAYVG